MSRRVVTLAMAACAVPAMAACSSSSGTHVQSLSPSPSASTSSTTSSTSSSSPDPTSSSSSTSSSAPTSSKGVPTPTVTPPAQSAAAAYISFYNALNVADRDPAHADLASINRYLTGKALELFDGVITGQAKAHLAYRGTPEQPRVSAGQIISPTFLFLSSCPLASRTDPFVQYDVKTGKSVPVSKPAVPPPWRRTISMKKVDGSWKITDFLVDASKTCIA